MGEASDVVRRALRCFNERDVDGLVELCSSRIEFHDVPEIPGSRDYRGHEGMRDWVRTVTEVSDDLRFQAWEMEEAGDAVMVETSAEMTGSGSGAAVGWRFWTVWRVRDGLIAYHHGHSTREDALADLTVPPPRP